MAELLPIWNSTDLSGAATLRPFPIPNNPNARGLKINNQSRYWILIQKTATGQNVDRIEPFSYITMPFESDISLAIDTSEPLQNSLTPDTEFVDFSTLNVNIGYTKGSTLFSGSTPTIITATTSKKIVSQQQLSTAPLSSGSYETYYFYSPVNTMSTIIGLYVDWGGFSGGSATSHRYMSFNINTPGFPQIPYMYASALDSTKEFSFSFNNFLQNKAISSNITVLPGSDVAALAQIVRGITFDANNSLEIQFYTDDINDNTQRKIVIYAIQETIAT